MCAQKVRASRQVKGAVERAKVTSSPEPSTLQKPEVQSWQHAVQGYPHPRHRGRTVNDSVATQAPSRAQSSSRPFFMTQQYLGNQAVLRRLQSGLAPVTVPAYLQSRLRIVSPHDPS